jgi:hypothetical protein
MLYVASGRVGLDRAVSRLAFALVCRTWIRWTRRTPQQLVRALTVLFAVAQIWNLEASHIIKPLDLAQVVPDVALLLFVGFYLDRLSHRTNGLNSYDPPLSAAIAAGEILGRRSFTLWLVVAAVVEDAGFNPTSLAAWTSCAGLFVWAFAYLVLTMGRPQLPEKKVRERRQLRLPRLLPARVGA